MRKMLPKHSGTTPATSSELIRTPKTPNQKLLRPIALGDLRLDGNIIAAPMAGYSDRITRGIAVEAGAFLAFTEMISAEALRRNSEKTIAMMLPAHNEGHSAVQLFGSDPAVLGEAAQIARDHGADLLDLNAGCPVPKVCNKGAGAALSRDPELTARCIEAMTKSGLPVSVKIRSGWDSSSFNWPELAAAVQQAGVSGIGFHPRTREQAYGGEADWTALAALVDAVDVPVIGSGDLHSPQGVRQMLVETGCAGVMLARASVGNPWIYSRSIEFLKSGVLPVEPSKIDRLRGALSHLIAAAEAFGETPAAGFMKKQLAGYLRGWSGASELRGRLLRLADFSQIKGALQKELADS